MNNRKTQNSILVLATLGVYLGLVLVGAAPQVLANAAMTRQFDVKDEIEVKDDLDRNPDPASEELQQAVDIYFEDLTRLLSDLDKVRSKDRPNLAFDSFSTQRISYSPCQSAESNLFRDINSAIDNRLADMLSRTKLAATLHLSYLSDCLPYVGFKDQKQARKTGIEITYDKKEFKYQVLLNFGSFERTNLILDGIGDAFEASPPDAAEANQVKTVLYKHTQLTSIKNQVFIVTRLPRAGL